jgi:hypothetical protein
MLPLPQYPVFDELESAFGAVGPFLLGGGVIAAFIGLGFADRALASGF